MKVFTEKEIKDKRLGRTLPLDQNDDVFSKHSKQFNFLDARPNKKYPNQGNFFLYELVEVIDRKSVVYEPKLGMYQNVYGCDQTVEIEWVDYRRTWENNMGYIRKIKDHKDDYFDYKQYAFDERCEFRYCIFWDDDMLLYGVWDKMPNWKELRQAYEKTWWYYRTSEEKRDIQLDRVLK